MQSRQPVVAGLAIDPADLLLRPQMDDFQLMDFHRAREAIEAGRACIDSAASQLLSVVAQANGAAPKSQQARTGD